MQKSIRVTAIIATVLVGLSLILLIVSIPFQGMIAPIFNSSAEVIAMMPRFPLASFLTCLLQTVLTALLIICCGNKKGGIWLELLVLCCLVIVLPAISSLAADMQTVFIARFGAATVAAHSVASEISSYCLIPSDLGQALACISCGMSIVFKKMSKKQNTSANE